MRHAAADPSVIGTYGPMTVRRLAAGPKLGYVLAVELDDGERVTIRSTPKGKGPLMVEHRLWTSEGGEHA